MLATGSFGIRRVFWSVLWVLLVVIWMRLLIIMFGDIFCSNDLGGWVNAIGTIFVIVLPYLGVFVYVIARGHKMGPHAVAAARAHDEATRHFIREGAGTSARSAAAEVTRLAELRDRGELSQAEIRAGRSKALSEPERLGR